MLREGTFGGKFGRKFGKIFSDPLNKGSKCSGRMLEHFV